MENRSSERSTCQGNARLPGRGQTAPPPDDSLLVREQGDLPARAGVERVGRLRQAAVRRHRGRRAARGRYGPEDSRQLRQERAHDHRLRQRHRHVASGGHRAHRHHRQVRDARVLPASERRRRQGRAADRAVRRRLLLLLHRRRPRDAGDAPRRPSGRGGRAVGERRRRRLQHRTDPEGHARHRRHPAPAPGRGRAAVRRGASRRFCASTPTTSPSRS